MIDHAGNAGGPTCVLVVTVWSDSNGLHRLVSLTGFDPHPTDAVPELQRSYAPSNAAVLALVGGWLEEVQARSHRLHAVPSDPTTGAGDARPEGHGPRPSRRR